MKATAKIESKVERTIAAMLVELWPLLPSFLSPEGIAVALVGFEGIVMLDGAADGSGLLVSVGDGDGVPTMTGGSVGVGIVVNWPKVAVFATESPGPAVAEATTDTCAGSPARVRPGVKG